MLSYTGNHPSGRSFRVIPLAQVCTRYCLMFAYLSTHLDPSSSHRDYGRHARRDDAFRRFGISVTPPGTCPLFMKGHALTRNATPEGGTALAVENVHGMHHGAPLQPLEERSCVPSRAGSPAYIACTEDECPGSHLSDVGLTMRPSFLTQEVKREERNENNYDDPRSDRQSHRRGLPHLWFGWDGYRLRRSHERLFRVDAER